ncbi:hypothetical protein S83_047443, partial [Arachis hypogaea]
FRKCPGSHHADCRIPASIVRRARGYFFVAPPTDLRHSHPCHSTVASSPLVTRIPKAKPTFAPPQPPPRRSFTQCPWPPQPTPSPHALAACAVSSSAGPLGLNKMIKWVEDRSLKRVAVTNAPRPNAKLMISKLGRLDFFDVVIISTNMNMASLIYISTLK